MTSFLIALGVLVLGAIAIFVYICKVVRRDYD